MLATGPGWPPETGSNPPERLTLLIDFERVRGFDLAAGWSWPIRFGIRWGRTPTGRANCLGAPLTTQFLYPTGSLVGGGSTTRGSTARRRKGLDAIAQRAEETRYKGP